MARFAPLTLPDAGHLNPIGAIGTELVRRGHEVTVILRGKAAPIVEQLQFGYRKLDVDQIPWPYERSRIARLCNRLGYAAWRWFMRPTLRVINRYRNAWGLRRYTWMDDSYSSLAQISQLFPEFDFPHSTLPACFHYVGSLAAGRHYAKNCFPWDRLDGRPIIYASLGTVADPMNRPVYPKIAAACQGLPAGQEAAHDLPGDPLVVDFAPQLALLDRVAVLITHAGLNTTLEAISRGVPMVALPRSADQPGNAARIAYSGAGLCAPFHHGTPQALRGIIQRVMSEAKFRRRAEELGQAMHAAGGAPRAAEIIEQALLTRQPVMRGQIAVPTRAA